ncbi:MAG: AbrB/MazE/SpoVT family DNA-binding domain-containing protein [archaeon]|nr:AbrB/MazE/SpoVT family DNA-binding domain-containing protein [archaeon]
MNNRGQIVIPEEIRNSLGLKGKDTLVLIEKDGEIILRKESVVANKIESEDGFWQKISEKSLEGAWGKEDEVWDKIASEDLK